MNNEGETIKIPATTKAATDVLSKLGSSFFSGFTSGINKKQQEEPPLPEVKKTGIQNTEQGQEQQAQTVPPTQARTPYNIFNFKKIEKKDANKDTVTNEGEIKEKPGFFTRQLRKIPVFESKTLTFMSAAATTAASVLASQALENSGTLKGLAQALHSAPIIGTVMGPLVMVAIILEMAQLNEILKDFLRKINVILKQMLYTIQFITDIAILFNGDDAVKVLVLDEKALKEDNTDPNNTDPNNTDPNNTDPNNNNNTDLNKNNSGGDVSTTPNEAKDKSEKGILTLNKEALDGITKELADFTEIISLYYNVKNPETPSENKSRFSKFKNSISSAVSKVPGVSLLNRAASYMNTFSSVKKNTDKAMTNIVISNMNFNSIFSQLEFQLKMIELMNPEKYKEKMKLLLDYPSYQAIVASGKEIEENNDDLTKLINGMKGSLITAAAELAVDSVKDEMEENKDVNTGTTTPNPNIKNVGGSMKSIDDYSKMWKRRLSSFLINIKLKNKNRRKRLRRNKKHKSRKWGYKVLSKKYKY
jgi:hypothetical protein